MTDQNNNKIDVSPRALAIARQIDRLGEGIFNIRLHKSSGGSERWTCNIEGVVEVKKFEPFDRSAVKPDDHD